MKTPVWLCQWCIGALRPPRTKKKKKNLPNKQKVGMHQMGHCTLKQREIRPHMSCHAEVRSLTLAVL